jgi:hypothetical protein
MKKGLLFLLIVCCAAMLHAQTSTITYSEHIAPIIYTHCTKCHRTGEIAPFPLTNYTEVQANATNIKHATTIQYMPPWKADVSYQNYQKENYLSAADIQMISDWVTGGTPQGNPALEPPLPVFPTGSQIGVPDKVISFSQSYTHVGNNTDEYRNFAIPMGLTQDQDLVALEVRPGNRAIVHHALFWADTTGTALAADSAAPGYGYPSNLNNALAELDGQLPSYVPGQKPTVLSNGLAYKLRAGSVLKGQFHYAPGAVDETDSTTFNLFFAQQPATRYVKSHVMVPLLGVLINGPFYIPANQVKEFHGTYTMPEDASMLSTMPHMHKLGTHWKVFAIKPTGDTVNLIKINSWDFNWQGNFDFKNLLHLPQGTVIHALAGYDNTTNNVNNPHNPPVAVTWGENTTDEMYYLPLQWVSYRTGDESLVLDSTSNPSTGIADPRFYQLADKLYPVAPNPASGKVQIGFTMGNSGMMNLKLYNLNGQEVSVLASNQYYMEGLHNRELDLSTLAAGEYILSLQAHDKKYEQRIVVINK